MVQELTRKGSFRVFHHQKAFMEKRHFSMAEKWPSMITAGTAEGFKLKKKQKNPNQTTTSRERIIS